MSQYKILIDDRNYSNWRVYNFDSLSEVDESNEINKLTIEPTRDKLFSSDVFTMSDNNMVHLLHSSVRAMSIVPGILVLNGNKTYGKYKDKYLYKCIPDDRRLPIFIVPYAIKIGFNKNIDNKYIVFKFDHWTGKHPQGTIISVLGDVDKLDNFYEYQLYCKSLHASIQNFNKAASQALKLKTEDEFIKNMIQRHGIVDRTNVEIFSIDSKQTSDYDDAFSIHPISNDSYLLSIYIANVPIWLEELQLWDSFTQRISTIYLPDRKRPMMPTVLSECLCSLCQDVVRLAFVLDITILNGEITEYKFENAIVKLYKNHVYDSTELLNDANYKQLFSVANILSRKYKYLPNIKTSYDLVSYLMILMNYYSATEMIKYNNGIYRSVEANTAVVQKPQNLPENVDKFLTIWNSSAGHYDLYDARKCHEFLNLDSYIHCTSPIRRLVDLLNMSQLQINLNMVSYGPEYQKFYTNWTNKLDYINTTMRCIRKIQNDCNLLHMCSTDPEICLKEYDGYLFDKIVRNDGLFQYIVYIPELKTASRVTYHHDIHEYSKQIFKVFVFNDEDSLKKKIRLHLVV